MKKLMIAVLSLTCMAGVAVAGNIDSPGAPSAGSGMYTLQNVYDYLTSGTALTVAGSFQEPTAGPGSTMKTTKQLGDDVKALFDQCSVTTADVKAGKKFFSTQSGNWGVKQGALSMTTGLIKTGQTASYRTGDDGTYQKGLAIALGDCQDGTIIDANTGLMWAKVNTGAGCASGSNLVWSSAVDWAEGLVFAGYSDWRLPNKREIESIVRSPALGTGVINQTFFPMGSASYWTATTYPVDTAYAWFGDWNLGRIDAVLKTGAQPVRAVRVGSNLLKTGQVTSYRTGDDGTYQKGLDREYGDNGDGTVTDYRSGLMWAKDGAAAGGANGTVLVWSSAIDWAEGLVFAGYSDWRLPNRRELESIVDQNASLGSPFVNKTYFTNTVGNYYWSSTCYPSDSSAAYALGFGSGHEINWGKAGTIYVRAVRGGN